MMRSSFVLMSNLDCIMNGGGGAGSWEQDGIVRVASMAHLGKCIGVGPFVFTVLFGINAPLGAEEEVYLISFSTSTTANCDVYLTSLSCV